MKERKTLYIGMVAVDQERGIGKNNQLLVHLPKDLAFFKKMTLNAPLIMGTKTLESFPYALPLPKREHFVLTKNLQKNKNLYDEKFEGLDEEKKKIRKVPVFFETFEQVQDFIKEKQYEKVFLVGGASVYQQFYKQCHAFYVTEIEASFEADVFFPDLSLSFEKYAVSELIEDASQTYRVALYLNKECSLTEEEKEDLLSNLP